MASSGNLTINSFAIENGAPLADGGAIYNEGTVTVFSGWLRFHSAIGFNGGAVYNTGTLNLNTESFNLNNANLGGGVYNTGTLNLDSNSNINNNNATTDGGGVYNLGIVNNAGTINSNVPNDIAP